MYVKKFDCKYFNVQQEIKTQGISNKGENKRILCTRLMHEPV